MGGPSARPRCRDPKAPPSPPTDLPDPWGVALRAPALTTLVGMRSDLDPAGPHDGHTPAPAFTADDQNTTLSVVPAVTEVRSTSANTVIVANGRILSSARVGVYRYASQLLTRLRGEVRTIVPGGTAGGIRGHLWEQLALPAKARGHLLWSPATTGPLISRRQVVSVHDVAALDHPEWFARRFAQWHGWLVPKLVRRVSAVITGSRFTKSRLVEITGVDPEKVTVIPDGVEERFSPKGRQEIDRARRQLGIEAQRYVLYVGTIEPRKNLPTLMRAWRKVEGSLGRDVCLVIAGDMGSARIFRQVALGTLPQRMRMIGRVDDPLMPALYSGAAALVFPSLYEGFGLPVLEAMACGTPVIATDRSSVPEVADQAALLVNPEEDSALAEAIRQVLCNDSLRERLSREGLARAGEFGWDRTAEMTLAVLRQAAEQRN